jgi:Rps23 Pro-64 3,4-dihydroxylase Tpa1-like proline 4-hydroxylase
MSYQIAEHVLSEQLVQLITDQFYQISDLDESSHTAWDSRITGNGRITAAYTNQLQGRTKTLLLHELYSRAQSPFRQMKSVIHCDVAAYKYPPGCWLPFHIDTCIASLTIFLNTEWRVDQGGAFQWIDSTGQQHQIFPRFNTGVYLINQNQTTSPEHGVSMVSGFEHRFSLQIFLRKPGDVAIRYSDHL